ncbi:helix-turn-helix domain-containing protein [Paraburkholderia rhizosphaerae]|uniref:AraC-like DNA-binding protein n=1 Tax=Paraburkholderia rhizosphaerae TaxID=480658 RepID=A0A4V3HF07_9BURK|nr:helix-turn-helix domain-containing protein [Paraburkholderia rhizosphaerae]TDY51001.1 AraC-like DNA-binding protein [Paraburkholderia rhizosphaerae]
MFDTNCENIWNGTRMSRAEWIDAMSSVGHQYHFDSPDPGPSIHCGVHTGKITIVNLDIAWQSASPIMRGSHLDNLFLQVVKSGTRCIEQRGQTYKLRPGDVAVVDPLTRYKASVHERTTISIIRIPRSALSDRGLRYRFPVVWCPDPTSPDVRAVRDFVLCLASQADKATGLLLARLGEQCLDLMDVLVNESGRPLMARSPSLIVTRAKQMILRRVCDPNLSPGCIAAALNMSTSSLTRALRANGLSVMRYVWSLRLECAARRLGVGASHGAIKAIAYQCGFPSHSHFSRAFKARYDMTPREYATCNQMARDTEDQDAQASVPSSDRHPSHIDRG